MRLGSDWRRNFAALILLGSVASWLVLAQPAPDPFEGARAGAVREISGARFCWAPAGSFRMGGPPDEPERRDDDGPADVTLTRGFRIGKYEVTQAQWTRVMGAFPREPDKSRGGDFAVYWVTWADADQFCRRTT